ncbi:hypothetical protein PACTADRAFT_3314 [Pachysolen tannophilus NRRL Y-2460]|uniref:Uncharacterized protein n=1 Tax=Pachysolen tannophilus NRRL Y-2460 TaxID=669874 RepID=A0A1E4TV06_PACTA|nr:hypothetical protein PACTADRAFT_3314 [Pachysolen tannophilus NRRL Y-2460]
MVDFSLALRVPQEVSEKIETAAASILKNKIILSYLPVTLVIGCTIKAIGFLNFIKEKNVLGITNPENLINVVFAGNAYYWCMFVFFLISILIIKLKHLVEFSLPVTLQDLNTENVNFQKIKPLLLRQLLKITLLLLALNACLYPNAIFDYVFKKTGAYCELGSSNPETVPDSKASCLSSGGSWVGGFDPSGHLFLTTNISLMVLFELKDLVYLKMANDDRIDQKYLLFSYNCTILISTVLLLIWWWLFSVTCIFFHTILEKIIGFLCGLITPLAVNFFF